MESNDSQKELKYFKSLVKTNLLWIIAMFIALVVFIITLVLGDSQRAGENLSFASTMVSIVLAVVAIVITLIDVAGQRKNIVELNETADDLQSSVAEVKSVIQQYQTEIKNITEMSVSLREMIDKNEKWREEVINQISKQDGPISKEKIQEIITDTPIIQWAEESRMYLIRSELLNIAKLYFSEDPLINTKELREILRKHCLEAFGTIPPETVITEVIAKSKKFKINTI
ncbi:hypothetical protein BBR47_35500 [Brevibacillus brevis NBRC 100599]|uniref:Uncharacterized protein n=1 Tax=Brevibacillus brevis (strain 47 / JCM 6285 / NBRC 100599) TaxID=358681 RepID=C0ZFG8_BREBN|nr:hypothetical protein [Brevibacillus brevis]BAH44527.1 hypothetical protein BBR47_35500 [Brevibacillus brevis NBRC 100599]